MKRGNQEREAFSKFIAAEETEVDMHIGIIC